MRAPDLQYRGYGYERKYHRLYCTYVQYSRKYFSVERERTARRDAERRGRLHAWGVPSRSSSGGAGECGRGGGAKRPFEVPIRRPYLTCCLVQRSILRIFA